MPKYIYQTSDWANFWIKTKDSSHKILNLRSKNFSTKIYEYRWILNQKIWFLPAAPVYEKDFLEEEKSKVLEGFLEFLSNLKKYAKEQKVDIIKLYLASDLSIFLELESQKEFLEWLQKNKQKNWHKGRKGFMYEQIMQLNALNLNLPKSNFVIQKEYLQEFFELNRDFWLQRNKTVRNQTKRSLQNDWTIDDEKTPKNIKLAYQTLLETAQRQGFGLPSEEYFEFLAKENFSHFWLLKNPQNQIISSWVGLSLDDRLVNLYGGNKTTSFENFGPNYLHLAGLALTKKLGLKYYDFGGYNSDENTAKFKDGYKGQIISFPGNINLGITFIGKILARIF